MARRQSTANSRYLRVVDFFKVSIELFGNNARLDLVRKRTTRYRVVAKGYYSLLKGGKNERSTIIPFESGRLEEMRGVETKVAA